MQSRTEKRRISVWRVLCLTGLLLNVCLAPLWHLAHDVCRDGRPEPAAVCRACPLTVRNAPALTHAPPGHDAEHCPICQTMTMPAMRAAVCPLRAVALMVSTCAMPDMASPAAADLLTGFQARAPPAASA
ncbi:MAG: hypothetical protein ABR497_05730 [Kiritimatiellia bacterium]|nr:hypothetical protein [Lentisphaerota bacterium]